MRGTLVGALILLLVATAPGIQAQGEGVDLSITLEEDGQASVTPEGMVVATNHTPASSYNWTLNL
ncbi:MAG: hypothetical protein R3185_09400, partial [Candidatus Thermoplasmatota archaeon]|nr:hypothetical protein [Candidatus Thermoplasmatota archaeon]